MSLLRYPRRLLSKPASWARTQPSEFPVFFLPFVEAAGPPHVWSSASYVQQTAPPLDWHVGPYGVCYGRREGANSAYLSLVNITGICRTLLFWFEFRGPKSPLDGNDIFAEQIVGASRFRFVFGDASSSLENEVVSLRSGSNYTAIADITIPVGYHFIAARWNGVTYDLWLDGKQYPTIHEGGGADLLQPKGETWRYLRYAVSRDFPDLYGLAAYERAFSDHELLELYKGPHVLMRPFVQWLPGPAPSGEVNLDIDDLRHGRPIDSVNVVVESADLDIQDLRHARPIDDVDVTIQAIVLVVGSLRHGRHVDDLTVTVDVPLFLSSPRHGRRVDEPLLVPTEEAAADDLRHGRLVDGVDVTELLGVTLDIANARHARPIDALLLAVDQPIIVGGLRHARPVDAPAVSPLLGDSTAVESTAALWRLNAGLPLDNANGADLGWHVIDGVFNGALSSLGVDGARVTGDAGVRDLAGLTVGADVDGNNRVQGQLAELRIYAGELTTAQRDAIINEMSQRWITG